MTLHSVNPATGLVLRSYQETDAAAVESCLVEAAEAQPVFAARDQGSRNAILNRAAELLESRAGEYARLMTLEMGKPIGAAEAEVAKCARVCRWYARHAERLLGDEAVATEASESFVRFEPLGVILAVMPWNFPFWQVFRFAAPAIAAGNAGLLKHASNVSGCAVAIEEVLRDAGAPRGIFQSLLIPSSRVEPLIRDPRVRAVTLTGSDPAGRAVAATAGDSLKKTVLELGGSDPFIVCADADLARAIATAVTARTINNGQSCIAAKRFLVERSIADEFEAGFRDAMAALRMG
ncbi:MAG: aldehyde dehydrogenase family protein, partial [marine benthic group bacterium]|nr:aldehyde dehydrogenase family protein [Gemmatimonadota bacterium]